MMKNAYGCVRHHTVVCIIVLAMCMSAFSIAAAQTTDEPQTNPNDAEFTGEILPVFYVSDVLRAVHFWHDQMGFQFHHYFDYKAGKQVEKWTSEEPPQWALLSAGKQELGIHLAQGDDTLKVGGMIHYFQVADVDREFERVTKNGVETSGIIEKPWMRMFSVHDPDGHELFFYTPPADTAAEREK